MTDTLLASARTEVHVVARRLNQRLGYIGAFGTDAILADDHHTIHEINPRICAGFSLLDQLLPEAAPLAGIDLVLRESPDASAALASPLVILSTVLERLTTPAYRLWEAPNSDSSAGKKSHQEWAQQVRKMASGRNDPRTPYGPPSRR